MIVLLGTAYEVDPSFVDLQMYALGSEIDATVLDRISIAGTCSSEWPCVTQQTWQDTRSLFRIVHNHKHCRRQVVWQVAGQADKCLDTTRRSPYHRDVMRGHEP